MKWVDVRGLIERYAPEYVQVFDRNGYQVGTYENTEVNSLLNSMDEDLRMLEGYKTVLIKAKKHKADKLDSQSKWQWQVDFQKGEAGIGSRDGGMGNYGGMGFTELLGFVEKRADERLASMEAMYAMRREYDKKLDDLTKKTDPLEKLYPMMIPIGMKFMGMGDDIVKAAFMSAMPMGKVAAPGVVNEKKNTANFTEDQEKEMLMDCFKELDKINELISLPETLQYLKDTVKVMQGRKEKGKEMAGLMELIQRAIKTPDAIDDALIFLRVKQGAI